MEHCFMCLLRTHPHVITPTQPNPNQHPNADGAPAVAFFWADWHEPSKPKGQMDAVVTHLAALHPQLRFLRVEAEAVPEVSFLFSIAVVPTFVLLRGGAWGACTQRWC